MRTKSASTRTKPTDTSTGRRRRSITRRSNNNIFKVIVGLEIAFLIFMWTVVPDKIQSFGVREHFATPKQHNSDKPYNNKSRRRQEARQRKRPPGNGFHPFFHHHSHNHGNDNMQQQQHGSTPKEPTLIIGGSDGSGTRAIAATVQRLGVPMKMDDGETLDIWAPPRSGGWSRLVNMVLNATHSVNYDIDDLPQETREVLVMLLKRFWRGVKRFGFAAADSSSRPVIKTGVFAGFKAPATMVLLPLLKEVIGPIKYIHVVRDGRDIALSKNQSPVQKFYHSMYTDADERIVRHSSNGSESVLAMNLWNDWNTESLQWQQAHENDAGFDFMVVRSEDVLNPETKLETLARIAAFVGSPIDLEALCDMSQKDAIDFGQSKSWNRLEGDEAKAGGDNNDTGTRNNVNKRYGKWKQILKDNEELSAKLHSEGARGLAAFGYEPPRSDPLKLGSQIIPHVDTSKCKEQKLVKIAGQ